MKIVEEVKEYLIKNSDKPIYIVYKELKEKKKKTKAENLVFTYLKMNKGKLGIK